MADTFTISAEKRQDKASIIRRESLIPAVVYGKEIENQPIQIDYQTFRKTFKQTGYNTLIDLEIGGKKTPVLVQDIELHPVRDTFMHVDFVAIIMGKEIETSVPLKFTGVAKAVKDLAGTLLHNRDELTVKCLPKDLIHEIEVDISVLDDFQVAITIGDLKVPDSVSIQENPKLIIAKVTPPKVESEETEEEATEGEAAAEGEADGEEKKEEKSEG